MNDPVTERNRAAGAGGPAAQAAPGSSEASAQLPHEASAEEPYRPELVARLERAVRLGRYRPDARAIADALVSRIDALE